MTDSARGAIVFATILGGAGMILWLIFNHVTLSLSDSISDPEVRLCDQAVDALLHSKDLVEVTRAGLIVNYISCGIGRRLP